MSRLLLVTALSLFVLACDPPAEPDPASGGPADRALELRTSTLDGPRFEPSRTQGAFDYVFYDDEPMKPAYMDRTLAVAKGDWASDVRAASPERYAITAAPEGYFRPMVEWEPMEAVVLAFPSSMSNYDGITTTVSQIAAFAAPVMVIFSHKKS